MMEAGSLKTYPVRMVKVVCSSLQASTKPMLVIAITETSATIFGPIISHYCQKPMRIFTKLEITNSGVTVLVSIVSWWQSH